MYPQNMVVAPIIFQSSGDVTVPQEPVIATLAADSTTKKASFHWGENGRFQCCLELSDLLGGLHAIRFSDAVVLCGRSVHLLHCVLYGHEDSSEILWFLVVDSIWYLYLSGRWSLRVIWGSQLFQVMVLLRTGTDARFMDMPMVPSPSRTCRHTACHTSHNCDVLRLNRQKKGGSLCRRHGKPRNI